MLYANILTKEITFIDPKGAGDDEIDNIFKNFVLNLKNSCKELNKINFTLLKIIHQIQQDSYNCGVFVCHFFDLLVNGKLQNFNTEINIDAYRNVILKRISEHSKITRCCFCKNVAKNSRIKDLFTDSLIKYEKCPHIFHKKCLLEKKISNKACISCDKIKDLKKTIHL